MRKKKQSTQKKFTFNLIRGFFRGHAPSPSLQTAHVCIGSGGRDIEREKRRRGIEKDRVSDSVAMKNVAFMASSCFRFPASSANFPIRRPPSLPSSSLFYFLSLSFLSFLLLCFGKAFGHINCVVSAKLCSKFRLLDRRIFNCALR